MATGPACDPRGPTKMISEAAATMDISSLHPPLNSQETAGGGRVQGIDRTTIHRLLKTLTYWSLIESQGGTY